MFTALIGGVITKQDYVFGGCYRLTDIHNVCNYYALSLSDTMSVTNKCRKLTDQQCYPKRNPGGNKSWKNDKYQNEIVYHKTRHTCQSIAIGINTKWHNQ